MSRQFLPGGSCKPPAGRKSPVMATLQAGPIPAFSQMSIKLLHSATGSSSAQRSQVDGGDRQGDKRHCDGEEGDSGRQRNAQPPEQHKARSCQVRSNGDRTGRPSPLLQKVVEVLAVAQEWRNPFPHSAYDRQAQVEERKARKCNGKQPMRADRMVNAIEIQSKEGQKESQNGAAGISHEDARRWKVKEEKSHAGAEHRPGNGRSNRRGP